MTLQEKLPRIQVEILSFAEHHDADAAVRKAGLEAVKRFVDEQIAVIDAATAEQAAAFA